MIKENKNQATEELSVKRKGSNRLNFRQNGLFMRSTNLDPIKRKQNLKETLALLFQYLISERN